jgi:hypothetical protein
MFTKDFTRYYEAQQRFEPFRQVTFWEMTTILVKDFDVAKCDTHVLFGHYLDKPINRGTVAVYKIVSLMTIDSGTFGFVSK